MNILFVCTGNCSRSPMAEAYFRHLCKQNHLDQDVTCLSAGIAVKEDYSSPEEAKELMKSLGLSLENHVPKQISEDLISSSDNIIVMDKTHVAALKKEFPAAVKEKGKVRTLLSFLDSSDEIKDPKSGEIETFQECFLSMMPALATLTDRIMRSLH